MVRLNWPNMSVLKNVTIKSKNFKKEEVWVAILKTGVCFNSDNPFYNKFYYKREIVINDVQGDKLQVRLRKIEEVILRFGSQASMDVFCKEVSGYTELRTAIQRGLRYLPCFSPTALWTLYSRNRPSSTLLRSSVE